MDDKFTVDDVKTNGFEENRDRHPDFVQNFWKDMTDPLDIEIDDSADPSKATWNPKAWTSYFIYSQRSPSRSNYGPINQGSN